MCPFISSFSYSHCYHYYITFITLMKNISLLKNCEMLKLIIKLLKPTHNSAT